MYSKNIAVVGLGKLGLPLALVLANKGFDVTGIDMDEKKLALISSGKSPIYEPGVQQLLRKNLRRLNVSSNFNSIQKCGVIFVIVPTPSERSGEFSLHFVTKAIEGIGKALRLSKKYHVVVITSTVMPGSMDDAIQPSLERSSGKVCGKDIGLCYNPEFIALGDVVRGMTKPDLVLIGESDSRAGKVLSSIHKKVCENSPRIERMGFANAELTKISINSFVTMKMSFANTLAEICEKMPGGNAETVLGTVGRDHRIGNAYLKGAMGYGGPCFPRDNIAFATFAKRIGAQARLAITTHEVNDWQGQRLLERIQAEELATPKRVSVLGLSYKPNTDVVEASQSFLLAISLCKRGFEVHIHDPAIRGDQEKGDGQRLIYESNEIDCVRASDLCVIATPWSGFSKIDPKEFRNKIVYDCWGIFETLPQARAHEKIGHYSRSSKLIVA